MPGLLRSLRRTFDWGVLIRIAPIPAVGYVLTVAVLGGGRHAALAGAVQAAAFLADR